MAESPPGATSTGDFIFGMFFYIEFYTFGIDFVTPSAHLSCSYLVNFNYELSYLICEQLSIFHALGPHPFLYVSVSQMLVITKNVGYNKERILSLNFNIEFA